MTDLSPHEDPRSQLDHLAHEIYIALADQFPVCISSDEFHFFPQFKTSEDGALRWDDFSENAVQSFLTKSARWQDRLLRLTPDTPASDFSTDVDLLHRALTTLEEQLRFVQCHKSQPTLYLTILSIGLAESLDGPQEAFDQRIMAVPAFLDTAMMNLPRVPDIFADLSREMASRLMEWMPLLPLNSDQLGTVMGAMEMFLDHIGRAKTALDFRLQGDWYARVAENHMGCRMKLDEIAWHLDNEIEASTRNLVASAHQISPDTPWQAVFHGLPSPEVSDSDIITLYHDSTTRLRDHCLENGFFLDDAVSGCDVKIETIAEHMMPVRANAAYTMPPGHPPAGGVFYILPDDRQPVPRDMLLLAAHETFPGHHLLDTMRWQLKNSLRRSLEFPLFYEGWACFGEEILFDTGFFKGPVDRLLMAKRRLWRAHRGRADFNIHSGQCRLEEAAAELAGVGLVNYAQALAMVRRYALKPGYQLSYTVGRHNFNRLYEQFVGQGHSPGAFVRTVLSLGEVGFDHLARQLRTSDGST